MRWYKIVTPVQTWDATGDPNALNVELDIIQAQGHLPSSGSYARIWGIPLQLLLQAKKFNHLDINVYGGMQRGLPLANPAQQGLLCRGTIYPALGNWVNTDMTLDFYIPFAGGMVSVTGAANVIHNWPKGQPLANAIKQALQTAFPKMTPVINISSKLVLNYADTGFYQSFGQYATYVFNISKSIMNSTTYPGVWMWVKGDKIMVQDAPSQGGAKKIDFQDLIGQPIWTSPNTIQFKTVMRGDFDINDTATLPPAMATLTASSLPGVQGSASNIIQGSFVINRIRHTGNFRQPDWPSWCSTFDARVA